MFATYRLLSTRLVVIRVIESRMVDHGGDHQVDVDSQGVVEHKPDESQESEDISYWEPCRSVHVND